MSLTYGTLKARLRTLTHRGTEIADEQIEDFVRQAEGVVARRLRCAEMMTRDSFVEADRVSAGIYALPVGWLQEGIIWNPAGYPMEKVGLVELRRYSASMDPLIYSPLSSTEIEFRGSPGTDATLEQIYFKRPDTFDQDADTNDILTNHETIYINAGMSALYTYTQDLELAQGAAGTAEAAIETLNEQAGRLLAGARAEGAYNLSSFGSY